MKQSSHAKSHATSHICLLTVEREREGWKKRDWRSARWTDSWVVPLVQALRKRWQCSPSLNHNPSTPILPSPFVLLSFSLIPTSDHSLRWLKHLSRGLILIITNVLVMLPKHDADNEARHFVVTKAYHPTYQMLFVITLVATIYPQPLDL